MVATAVDPRLVARPWGKDRKLNETSQEDQRLLGSVSVPSGTHTLFHQRMGKLKVAQVGILLCHAIDLSSA